MLFSTSLLAALAFGAAKALPATKVSSSAVATPTSNLDLIAKLKTDATQTEKFQDLFTSNGQILDAAEITARTVYDFTKGGVNVQGTQGGSLNPLGLKNFPLLTNSGLSLNLLTLGPCGMFVPHIHPRANEFFLVIEGQIDFGFILEATVFGGLAAPNPTINGTLAPKQGTLFPLGSTHWQINTSCGNATTFEAFSSDDEGAVIVLNSITDDDRVIIPQPGPHDLDGLRAVLPPKILSVVDKCFTRCGI